VSQSFASYPFSEAIQKNLQNMGFETPTPIQQQAIPVALEGKDILASAQTGTGKTAAFSLPMIHQLLADSWKTALILVPTRELAVQIEVFLRQLLRGQRHLGTVVLIGGSSMSTQKSMLSRSPRIIVATPGRLVDHMGQGTVKLNSVGILVLDEADRMLDMGFAPQIQRIVQTIPKERQTLLFSATFPAEIAQIAKQYMKNPERIAIGEVSKPIKAITQTLIHTTQLQKSDRLVDELNKREGSALIFMRTKHRVDKMMKYLEEYGYSVARMHGNRSQAQRNQALTAFRNGSVRILVATDVASRGIDVDNIRTVINFDLPEMADDYIHRIGRTGRNGLDGEAICFLTPEDEAQWAYISGTLDGKKVRKPPVERPARRGRGGGGQRSEGRSQGGRRPGGSRSNLRSERPPARTDWVSKPQRGNDRPERSSSDRTDRPAARFERPQYSEKRRDRNEYEKRESRPASDRVRNSRPIGAKGPSSQDSERRKDREAFEERIGRGNRPSGERAGGSHRYGSGQKKSPGSKSGNRYR
jgi:superfamily II DNA/RNA helicase